MAAMKKMRPMKAMKKVRNTVLKKAMKKVKTREAAEKPEAEVPKTALADDAASQFSEPTNKAEAAIVAIAQGSTATKDWVGVKNHLNFLARKGNAGPLNEFTDKSTHWEKRQFVNKLAVDFQGSFCTVSEEREGARDTIYNDKEL